MHDLFVLATSAESRRVTLLDRWGGLHVTQALGELPPLGVDVQGAYPLEGLQFAATLPGGRQLPMTYVAVACSLVETFQCMGSGEA